MSRINHDSKKTMLIYCKAQFIYICIYIYVYLCVGMCMSVSAMHPILYLLKLLETSYTTISVNYPRMHYKVQIPIGELQYTVYYIMLY